MGSEKYVRTGYEFVCLRTWGGGGGGGGGRIFGNYCVRTKWMVPFYKELFFSCY